MAVNLHKPDGQEESMLPDATQKELQIIRTALHANRNSLQDRPRVYRTPYSAAGIYPCVHRMHVGTVIRIRTTTLLLSPGPNSEPAPAPNGSTKTQPDATMRRAA
jgi:hypothetical protein